MTWDFLECSFERFQQSYFPFTIPEERWDTILSKVLERRDIFAENVNGKTVFKAFMEPIPVDVEDPRDDVDEDCDESMDEDQSEDEDDYQYEDYETYRPFHEIAKAIAEAAMQVAAFVETRELNYVYRPCPQTMMHTDSIGFSYDNLVDAVFEKRCRCGKGELHGVSEHPRLFDEDETSRATSPIVDYEGGLFNSVRTMDIGCVFRLRTDGTYYRLTENMASATACVIIDDPRRMFGYGFTIEGCEVTPAYFCRSYSVEAEKLSLDNPDDLYRLIRMFISFMFATDEEMGYDPNVTRHEAHNGTTAGYTFKIHSSDVTDKRTRIWLVEEMCSAEDDASSVAEPAIRYVLKDVWHSSKTQTEKQIQDAIFKDIKEFLSASPLPPKKAELAKLQSKHAHLLSGDEFKRYFTTIVSEYQGRVTPSCDWNQSKIGDFSEEDEYEPKRQYRVIFKELCTHVGRMETLGDAMDILREILIPLQLMHCAGWVHRDISVGNILAYQSDETQPWQAKLSDLEYATKFPPKRRRSGDRVTNSGRIGTLSFMADEILREQYYTISDRKVEEARKCVRATREERRAKIIARAAKYKARLHAQDNADEEPWESETETSSIVVHNPQHDVESLWWVGLWMITLRVDCPRSREWASSRVFSDTGPRRMDFREEIFDGLYRNLHPDLRKPFAFAFEFLRSDLLASYMEREQTDGVMDLNAYKDVYEHADEFFMTIQEGPSAWREVKLRHSGQRELVISSSMHNQAHKLYGSSFTLYGWLVCMWALITSFQHGYHTSVLNQVEDVLTCKQTPKSDIQSISLPECIPMTDVTFSLITSIYTIGGLTGSLLAKYAMDRTGRRGANCISAFLIVLGTTVMALAGNVTTLLAGRFLIGVASGLGLCVTPIYLSEISPEKISGKIGESLFLLEPLVFLTDCSNAGMFTQLSIVIGIMVTEVVGLGLVGPSKTQSLLNFSSASISPPSTWRYVFLPSSALSALQLLVSITIVESPIFLLKSRTQSEDEIPDPDSASASAKRKLWGELQGSGTVSEESPLLLNRDDARSHEGAEIEQSPTEEKLSVRQLLKQKDLRNPLFIVCLAMIAQQVSGINPVLYYSNDILSKSLPTLSAYVSLGITVLNALVTVPAVLLVEKLGRKKLLAISTAGALLSLAVLGFTLDSAQNGTARIISSVAIILFVMSFAFGLGPVPFVLIPEVSPANAISALSSVGLSISWITNCLVGFAFLPLRNWLSGGEASNEGRVFYVIVVLLAVPAGMLFRVYKPSN
ncbi:hypothetical protein D9613_009239 [Agrocybe pediades]|uniref:Major facilitator superfamily (MFS) profile domain-containing protein n=1 Tax=Agrocybe pediades TaxID=84607 RepID=A0A8H4VUD9_9AGAR|nr:hypothetical protein D9613_009239 [Agrocybe pediades]